MTADLLFTSRFQSRELILRSGLVPVRITAGNPRFPLGYELGGTIKLAAPSRATFGLEREPFREAYMAKLALHELEIFEDLYRISREHDGRGLVLLCFEDLTKPDLWCHRTMLAEWIEQTHGLKVQELT